MYRGRYREEAERRAGFLLVEDQSVDSGREELRELACWNRTEARNRLEAAPLAGGHRNEVNDGERRRYTAVNGAGATQAGRRRVERL
jgi:hypothetical protein